MNIFNNDEERGIKENCDEIYEKEKKLEKQNLIYYIFVSDIIYFTQVIKIEKPVFDYHKVIRTVNPYKRQILKASKFMLPRKNFQNDIDIAGHDVKI